jgi:hypothetical protein
MATGVSALLAGATLKQKAEAANFEAFRRAHPNFAGRPLVSVQWGGDPPDVLCLDARGSRIGVELVQWVNGRQMAASKAQYELEESYNGVIQSASVQPPANIGMIFIYAKISLAPKNAAAFRKELYDCIGQVAAKYPEWEDPQGYPFTDFTGYPCLAAQLEGLDFYSSRRRSPAQLGIHWIVFRNHGGAYTPDWMRDALVDNIKRKIAKYAKPHNEARLKQQQLAEFYLLAYYDEAVLHNTPYGAPGFGFREIAAIVASELAANPHPFDKVFLYSPIEKTPVLQIWPAMASAQ